MCARDLIPLIDLISSSAHVINRSALMSSDHSLRVAMEMGWMECVEGGGGGMSVEEISQHNSPHQVHFQDNS